MPTPTNILHTTSVEMPDGTLVEVKLSFDFEYQRNPCDKDIEHYRPEDDDGWYPTDVSIAD